MKDLFTFTVGLFALAMAFSCEPESKDPVDDNKIPVENGGGADEGKDEFTELTVGLSADGEFFKSKWVAGETVMINGVESEPLQTISGDNATFTVKAALARPYYVISPAEAYKDAQTVVLPPDQSYQIYYAAGRAESLEMAPMTGALKVSVAGDVRNLLFAEEIDKVRVTGNDGEQLCGPFGYSYSAHTFESTTDAKVRKSTTKAVDGEEMLIQLPTGEYEKGFTLTFIDKSGSSRDFVVDGPVDIKAGEYFETPAFFSKDYYSGNSVTETILVKSAAMNKTVPVTVITPDCYGMEDVRFPVVYILHGYSDTNTKWSEGGHIEKLANKYNVIVVMPDGGYSSWYFDSPIDPKYRYETFVSSELIAHIDDNYKTIATPGGRAITGNSMGGHGAMYNAIRHQDVFGNVGSTSGGVDFRPFPNNWDLAKRLGTIEEYPENWENNTVINMTHLIKSGLNIIFDCGTDDFFYQVNCNLHEKLKTAGIPHEYRTSPGAHNWTYWFANIEYQFIFFNDHFMR